MDVIAFDPLLWNGRDVGDNSQFWKPATIIRRYSRDGQWFVDLKFHHREQISRGHIESVIRK